jgi:hypothetical protein
MIVFIAARTVILVPNLESRAGEVVVQTIVESEDEDGEGEVVLEEEVEVEPRAVSEAPRRSWRTRKELKIKAVKRYWYLVIVREWMRSWYRPGGRLDDGQRFSAGWISVEAFEVLAPRARRTVWTSGGERRL